MKVLGILNAVGVVILTTLAVWQWRVDRGLNLRLIDLDRTRQEQARTIDEQNVAIAGYKADLDEIRDRLTKAREGADKLSGELDTMTAARDKLAEDRARVVAERDRLLTDREIFAETLDSWKTAVAQRDAALAKANESIKTLAKQRDDAVAQCNDVVKKYDTLIDTVNQSRQGPDKHH